MEALFTARLTSRQTQESNLKNTINRAQRNFVVEYKSRDRRPKLEGKSIWGDTNFKALAQAVADDMPHADIEPECAGRSDPQQEKIVGRTDDHLPAPGKPPEAEITTMDLPMWALPVDDAETLIVLPTTCESKNKIPRETALVRKARKIQAPETFAAAEILGPTSSFDHYDILTVLEMENQRLKQLLADKLRSENTLMRAMLQQFEA